MREYGVISPKFWTGSTGKSLRGDPVAQVVAVYLMTSPHATMIGVFYCPVSYIAHETGIPLEGASKALQRLSEGAFCTYNEQSEYVFVMEMAKHQIDAFLKPNDNRVKSVQKEFDKLPEGPEKLAFYQRYGDAFCMAPWSSPVRGSEGAPEALRSQKQEQEQNSGLSHEGTELSVDNDGVIHHLPVVRAS